jgi:hypothetical protein
MYMYIHICIYTCIYKNVGNMNTLYVYNMYICISITYTIIVYLCARTTRSSGAHFPDFIYIYIRLYKYRYIHIFCICVSMYIYIYMRVRTYVCMYVCIRVQGP